MIKEYLLWASQIYIESENEIYECNYMNILKQIIWVVNNKTKYFFDMLK